MSRNPNFPRVAQNNMKVVIETVEDNNSLPEITALKGLSLPCAPYMPVLHVEQGCLLCRDGPCFVTTSRQNRHDGASS